MNASYRRFVEGLNGGSLYVLRGNERLISARLVRQAGCLAPKCHQSSLRSHQ